MSITKEFYGNTADGRSVDKYIIKNSNGVSAEIITFGATLDKVFAPDKNGKFADVLIGFDDIKSHETLTANQGMTIGRYANRIAKGKFTIDGVEYEVTHNENETCLHGGDEFSHAVWNAEVIGGNSVKFTYFSPDGACGFPGNLNTSVVYTLDDENALKIDYRAVSDKKTVLNFTNHAYFNLGGYNSGDICGHILQVDADRFTPIDSDSIPTGELRNVEGTPFDFRTPKAIGKEIKADYEQLVNPRGYDHNFCINNPSIDKPCAVVVEPESGRKMEVYTDLPGVQLYCGNFLDNVPGKGGAVMNQYSGFCLETQYWPDSPNKPEFPSCTKEANEEFKTTTIFKFTL